MKIIIDLDGTICELRKQGQSYADVRPNPGVADKITELKTAGHYIVIQTARHMKTCNGDINLVVERVGAETVQWLKRNRIPYDELHFGKQHGDIYLDDRAVAFRSWEDVRPEVLDDGMTNIVIPMAGLGSRFKKAGFKEPKPLIDILGEPMIVWAMRSFDFISASEPHRFIFIITKDDDVRHGLANHLVALFPQHPIEIITIPEVTGGQAETCLAARKYIETYGKLYIHNCDTFVSSPIGALANESELDGALVCFKSNDPKYSYAQLDQFGYVERTAEKEVISEFASTGMYFFRRGIDFVAAAERMVKHGQKEAGEFYVAPCYNELLASGKRVGLCLASEYAVFGTPEEREVFIRSKSSL